MQPNIKIIENILTCSHFDNVKHNIIVGSLKHVFNPDHFSIIMPRVF